jgi:hypothetical protein
VDPRGAPPHLGAVPHPQQPPQFLRLALPDGAELWSASVGGRAVQPAKAWRRPRHDPAHPLAGQPAAALAAFEVEVVYVESRRRPDLGPRPRINSRPSSPAPDAPSTYVAWTVYSPSDAKIRRASYDGSLRHVRYLSDPIPDSEVYAIDTVAPQVQQQAGAQADAGALGEGAVPVPVSLPLQGRATHFEKLLALDEALTVEFRYRGLKR